MTGSGTAASPYIVSTYGELVQAAALRDKYIEFPKEPGTINIEDEYGKTEPPALIMASGVRINGNGWGIHGLWGKTHTCIYTSAPYWQNYSYMTNLIFDSFHSQGDYFLNAGTWVPIQIQDCVFSGKCEKNFMRLHSIYYSSERNEYIRSSSMTIDFTSLTSPHFLDIAQDRDENRVLFSDCNMKLRSVGELTLFNFTNTYNKTDIQNCTFYLSSDSCKIFNTSSSGTIVSSCTFVGSSQSAIDIGNGTPQTVNVFDEEAFPNAVSSIKFVGVPHDKIGDAAYLSSIGLPIGVSDV